MDGNQKIDVIFCLEMMTGNGAEMKFSSEWSWVYL